MGHMWTRCSVIAAEERLIEGQKANRETTSGLKGYSGRAEVEEREHESCRVKNVGWK